LYAGLQLLQQMSGIEAGGNELCLLADHFEENLLAAFIDQRHVREIDNTRPRTTPVLGLPPVRTEFGGEFAGQLALEDPRLLRWVVYDRNPEHDILNGQNAKILQSLPGDPGQRRKPMNGETQVRGNDA
jgi:hypothetical protein